MTPGSLPTKRVRTWLSAPVQHRVRVGQRVTAGGHHSPSNPQSAKTDAHPASIFNASPPRIDKPYGCYGRLIRHGLPVAAWGDTIHFVPSDASRLVQGANLIAFMYQRYHARPLHTGKSGRAVQSLWKWLSDSVIKTHCWRP